MKGPITLGDIVDLIILLGALCAAIYKIWEFFAKPTSTLKQRALQKEKTVFLLFNDFLKILLKYS